MPLHIRLLALMALLLGGCALPPRPENLLLGAAPRSTPVPPATLVTDGGFCVALNEQGRLLTQPCDQEPNQLFIWDAGALLLAQGCLIATGTDGLVVGGCENDSHQWQWQGDHLFNRQVPGCGRSSPQIRRAVAAGRVLRWRQSELHLDADRQPAGSPRPTRSQRMMGLRWVA